MAVFGGLAWSGDDHCGDEASSWVLERWKRQKFVALGCIFVHTIEI